MPILFRVVFLLTHPYIHSIFYINATFIISNTCGVSNFLNIFCRFCLLLKLKALLFQTFWSEFLSHSCFQPLASTQSTENRGNRKEEWRTGTPRRTGGGTLFSLDLTSSSAPWSWTTQAASRNSSVSSSNVQTNFHPSVICWCQYSGDINTRNSPLPLFSMHY